MAFRFKALVFDLGGVLLEWDRHSINALSPGQFLALMNSPTWHRLDRGNVTLKEACKVSYYPHENESHQLRNKQEFGDMLGVDPSVVESAMEQAQLSLKPNIPLIQTIRDIKASDPNLRLYVMSNISRVSLLEHLGGTTTNQSAGTFRHGSGY